MTQGARSQDWVAAADALALEIRRIGVSAATEEDVRVYIDRAIEPVLANFELSVQPRFEEGVRLGAIASGRTDAIYGAVYIEYKRPGGLESEALQRQAIAQVVDYLSGVEESAGGQTQRVVGVITDARRIIFVRRRGPRASALDYYQDRPLGSHLEKGWFATEPLLVTRESVAQLLTFLRSLAREPLTAESLARAYGPRSSLGPRLVQALYRRLGAATAPLVQTLYKEWDRIFGIVYGQDMPRAADAARVLGDLYHVASPDLKPLVFAVHTYYALVMKLLAVEVASLQQGTYITSFASDVEGLEDAAFDRKLHALEDGSEFRHLEITNYLEGDFFRWYLSAWDPELRTLIRECVRALGEFEPLTTSVRPDLARDILKHLYQYLVPKEIRHDLGEYYTPDWLAEFVLTEANYSGDPSLRILDPACGSGTFLALSIGRVLDYANEHLLDDRTVGRLIVKNIVGFDLNPLAVLAARTTYLLALGHLIRYVRPLEIPVYLCDSILLPRRQAGGLLSRGHEMSTSVGPFIVPALITDAGRMAKFAETLERAVRGHHDLAGLVTEVERTVGTLETGDDELLSELYQRLLALDREGRNGIWPRIIKNNFAPMFVSRERFDFIVGNPPWVNWESLSDEYRRATTFLWRDHGLFSLKGQAARLGGGKKDLSMLMLYAAAQNYLRHDGRLAFLVTQTIFKSTGAGAGFRRFRTSDTTALKVQVVHDMTLLQPFEGATNRTALVVLDRDAETTYPVRWVDWRTNGGRRPRPNDQLDAVLRSTTRIEEQAAPIREGDPTSSWLTIPAQGSLQIRASVGKSVYRAHAGAYTGGLNGAFWIEILAERTDGHLLIRNLPDIGRLKVPAVEAVIEPDLVYPLLRGRDVKEWTASPSASIILAQDPETRVGYPEREMRERLPLTFEYLKRFEQQLRGRAAFRKYFEGSQPFYSMYNIGPYTMSKLKVVWREQASRMTAAIVGSYEARTVIPDHKLMLVPVESKDEASYLAGILNSRSVRTVVEGYASSTSMSTHVLEHIPIPRFSAASESHIAIARLGARAALGEQVEVGELDDLVSAVIG